MHAATATAQTTPRRPWHRRKRALLGAAAAVAVVIVWYQRDDEPRGQLGAARLDQSPESDEAFGDVAVGSIGPPGIGGLRAVDVAVTNNSAKRSDYAVDVVFVSRGGTRQHGSTTVTFVNLAPGDSRTRLVSPDAAKDLPSDAVAKIARVSRTESR